jgi:hypothetical protein
MVYSQTRNSNLGKFWRALDYNMLIYFRAVLNILQTLGIFYDDLVHFVFIRYIISGFGTMHQETSGNPVSVCRRIKKSFFLQTFFTRKSS